MSDPRILENLRILFVEDDTSQALLGLARLRKAGARDDYVRHVTTLTAAQLLLSKESFDAIILDLNLPDSAGLETFRGILPLADKASVVILSASSDVHLAQQAISIGAQEYLMKDELSERTLARTILHCVERTKLAASLRNAERDARRQSALKSEYLAQVSHEIRTPMNGVVGLASLLLQGEISAEQREMVEVIHRSGEALVGIISDILDFSKIESGKLTVVRKRFNVREIVEDVVLLFHPAAQRKGIVLGDLVEPNVVSFMTGDGMRIKQIISNLLSNAVKFTREGGVVVRVSFRPLSGETGRLNVEVEDTGNGIGEDECAKIFEPFVQLEREDGGEQLGTGLGLAICARLAELMGGTLGVRSVLGKGSTFSLSIPVEFEKQILQPRPDLCGKKIAVVCDNLFQRDLLVQQLAFRGLQVRPFEAWEDYEQSASAETADDVYVVSPAVMPYLQEWMTQKALVKPVLVLVEHSETLASPFVALAFPGAQAKTYERVASLLGPQIPETPVAEVVEVRSKTHSATVLVVDDVEMNRDIAARMIEHVGHHAIFARDGLEALEVLERCEVQLVLMDCRMPRCNGWEATRRIRQLENPSVASVPIVGLTANAVEESLTECLAAGMNAVLHKPISFETLRRSLDEYLNLVPARGVMQDGSVAVENLLVDENVLDGLKMLELPSDEEPFVSSLIRTYLAESPAILQRLADAMDQKEENQTTAMAHKLKGFSRNIGAVGVATLCESIEHGGVAGSDDTALVRLRLCLKETEVALKKYQSSRCAVFSVP